MAVPLPWTPWTVRPYNGWWIIQRTLPDGLEETLKGTGKAMRRFQGREDAVARCVVLNQADRLELSVLVEWHMETMVPFAFRENPAGKRVVLGAKVNGGAFVVEIDGQEAYRGHDHAWALESFYAA